MTIETVGQLKKAFLSTRPDANRAVLSKAGEKFRRMANKLNNVASYIEEMGEENALSYLGSLYVETLAVPDGVNTSNRSHALELARQNR